MLHTYREHWNRITRFPNVLLLINLHSSFYVFGITWFRYIFTKYPPPPAFVKNALPNHMYNAYACLVRPLNLIYLTFLLLC